MSTHPLKAEVVIVSYNRLQTLERTVRRLRLLYPETPVCLGIQGPEPADDFRQIIESDRNIRLLYRKEPGITTTLNACIESSDADIVALLDDDSVPFFGWLEGHLEIFLQEKIPLYSGGREVRSTKNRSAFSEFARIIVETFFGLFLPKAFKSHGRIVGYMNRLGFLFGNFTLPGTATINSPRGCNMAIHRTRFLEWGGFNTEFKGNSWGFEAEFGLRAARQNEYGIYTGSAVVIHEETPTGGTRETKGKQNFTIFLANQKLLLRQLGPLGWVGSLPRTLKHFLLS